MGNSTGEDWGLGGDDWDLGRRTGNWTETMGDLEGVTEFYTLSGRTGSALVWHSRGRRIPVQQVLLFVGRVFTVQYVELRGDCPRGWGMRPVNWIYRL